MPACTQQPREAWTGFSRGTEQRPWHSDMHTSTAEIEKDAAKRDLRQRDFQLWDDWKSSGEDPDKLRPLLQNLRGAIRSRANRWAGHVDIPPAAVHAEFNKQALHALRTYDPNKGAAVSSWVTTNLKKAQRWITANQNPARILEGRVYKTGLYDNAIATLDDQLGREPTTQELSEHLKWSEPEVSRMQAEKRRTLTTGAFDPGYDPTTIMPSREVEILNMIRTELTPEELLVYEYKTGYGGKPQLKSGEIARKLGVSPSKVTRITQAIGRKMEKYQ